MSVFQIIILILASGVGAFAAWMLRTKAHSEFLGILLSFSGAFLLGTVVLHLLPEIFEAPGSEGHAHDSSIAIFVLGGFFIQLIIVQFTRGVEHGHLHLHPHLTKGYVFGVFFGLSLHALMEGLPLSSSAISSIDSDSLYYGILIHKIPETFALGTLLFFSSKKSISAIILLIIFALITPFGSFLGNYLIQSTSDQSLNKRIALVCGSLIHISTTIIFEASGKAHRMSMIKLAVIVGGFVLSLLSVTLH